MNEWWFDGDSVVGGMAILAMFIHGLEASATDACTIFDEYSL